MTGHVVEYAGPAIEALSMEGRMTVCNMTIEGGGRAGMIAPDETTFAWFTDAERPGAPTRRRARRGDRRAGASCAPTTAPSFDSEVAIDAAAISPQVTWGTNPGMVARRHRARARRPRSSTAPPTARRPSARSHYMALEPGTPIEEIAVDRVFIGSCTNSRIGDLRAAAEVVAGPQGRPTRQRDGRARLPAGQGAGRGRGPRPRSSATPASTGASPAARCAWG